jgi:hypothetical protein
MSLRLLAGPTSLIQGRVGRAHGTPQRASGIRLVKAWANYSGLTMTNHAIPALLKKRTELACSIDQRQSELVNMLSDLNGLDCAMRLFDPDISLPEIVMPPRDGRWAPDEHHGSGDPPHGFGADADRGYRG